MVIEVTFAIILLIPQIFQLLGCDELGSPPGNVVELEDF